MVFATPATWCGGSLVRRCWHRRRRRSRGDQCTPPCRQRRSSISATCRYYHRFSHQSYSHCRRRSSLRRHRYRRLRGHRCLPPSPCQGHTRSRSGFSGGLARRRCRSPMRQRFTSQARRKSRSPRRQYQATSSPITASDSCQR